MNITEINQVKTKIGYSNFSLGMVAIALANGAMILRAGREIATRTDFENR